MLLVKKIELSFWNKSLLGLLSLLTALTVPAENIPNSRYAGKLDRRPVPIPQKIYKHEKEMRGIWVATIFNIDYQRPKNVAEFKKFYSNCSKGLTKLFAYDIMKMLKRLNGGTYGNRTFDKAISPRKQPHVARICIEMWYFA